MDTVSSDTSIEKLDPEDVFRDHESARFRFILPVEGDVIHTPHLQVVIALGPEAFASVAILLDGFPLPDPAVTQGRVLTASLPNLSHGIHRLSVIFLDENSKILYKKEIPFFAQLPEPERRISRGDLKQSGTFFLQSDYRGTEPINNIEGYRPFEVSGGNVTRGSLEEKRLPQSTTTGHLSYQMKHNRWKGQGRLSLNTRETAHQQPYHRLGGRLSYGPWFTAAGGDVYPHMNDLVLKDVRMRGGESEVRYVHKETEWASLKVAHGDVRREVDPHVLVYQGASGLEEDTIPGTYSRTLTAARLGFGASHQLFNLGITALRSRDRNPGWNDAFSSEIPRYSREENAVVGVDLQFLFWQQRIALFTDAAYGVWTPNRDAALLGSDESRIDFTPGDVTPEDIQDLITLNVSSHMDYKNPMRNLALQSGFRFSLPTTVLASESEAVYYQTGDYYKSEGNPFLTNTGELGVKLLQRLKLLNNRLALGGELTLGQRELYTLDTTTHHLNIVTYKADARYSPRAHLPSMWVGIAVLSNEPGDTSPGLTPKSSFENRNLYLGGYHHLRAGPGKIYTGMQYTLSQNHNRLIASALDTLGIGDTTFETNTHIFSSTFQYRRPRARLIPFFRYVVTAHEERLWQNNVNLGSTLLFSNRLSATFTFLVGQHPMSTEENELRVGESVVVSYAFLKNHSLYFQERVTRNGEEWDIYLNGNYEIYF